MRFLVFFHILILNWSEESYWKTLTPESAVLARAFIEHSLGTQGEANVEGASLPVVTAFAFYVQQGYNDLLAALQEAESANAMRTAIDDDEADAREEDLAKQEVILSEILRMALKLDYMDEIGRRKIFSVVRKAFDCNSVCSCSYWHFRGHACASGTTSRSNRTMS